MAHPKASKDRLLKIEVYLTAELLDAIDARRGTYVSRSEWVRQAAALAIEQHDRTHGAPAPEIEDEQ